MDATMFSELLQGDCAVSETLRQQVNDACRTYPYCASLQLLSFQANALMDGGETSEVARLRTELYLRDSRRLRQPLLRREEPKKAVADVDVLKEINAYHEISFKTAPKSVILSHFLETADVDVSADAESEAQSVEDLGRKSVLRDDDICTETLALVLVGQGKKEEAISVYQRLMQKYPEKSATFASRIETLQKEVNN